MFKMYCKILTSSSLSRITTEKFKSLAEEIVSVFPTEEQDIYYTPYKKVDDMRFPPTGKLWDHFNYVKARIRKDVNRSKKVETVKEVPEMEITGTRVESLLDESFNLLELQTMTA